MNVENYCSICNSSYTQKLRSFSSYHRGPEAPEQVDLFKCKNCDIEFLSPQPTSLLLDEEYKNYYSHRQRSGIPQPRVILFKQILRTLKIEVKKCQALEVGGAEGDFATAFVALNPKSDIFILEPNTESKNYLKSTGIGFINASVEDFIKSPHAESFEYIFMFDVLEHLRDPQDILNGLQKNVMKKNSDLVMTFPLVNTWSRKLMGPHWIQYKLEHLFYYSEKSIHNMAKTANLRVERFERLYKKLPIGYLLSVGTQWGPTGVRKAMSFLEKVIPNFVKSWNVCLPLGEALVVLRQNTPTENNP